MQLTKLTFWFVIGSKDFGWDPIFEPTEEEQGNSGGDLKTYAEMSKDAKNAISHRGRAFNKFRDYLLNDAWYELGELSKV